MAISLHRKAKIAYHCMLRRCLRQDHQAYKDYGGRGITVCQEWVNNFDAFITDLGYPPDHNYVLGRIDHNKGYTKTNCRWEHKNESQRLRRNTQQIMVDGVCLTIEEAARKYKILAGTLRYRINKGMLPDLAVQRRINAT